MRRNVLTSILSGILLSSLSLGYFSDAEHPYPPMDINQDCHVNLSHFAILAANWLECTAPACD